MQVHKEYDILKRLSGSVRVAKPIHCSNDKEEKAVGAPFIVRSYVQVSGYLAFFFFFFFLYIYICAHHISDDDVSMSTHKACWNGISYIYL